MDGEAIAFKLLEQDFAVMFNEIHYSFPSTGGRMPAARRTFPFTYSERT